MWILNSQEHSLDTLQTAREFAGEELKDIAKHCDINGEFPPGGEELLVFGYKEWNREYLPMVTQGKAIIGFAITKANV